MRDNDMAVRAGPEIMDMSAPVQGPGGTMYPLVHHRAEDVDIDFVLDIDETVLVVAPDVILLTGAKGGLLWLVGMIVLVDIVRIVRVVNTVGGGQTYQLVLADVDPSTGRVGAEFVAGKGDLIGAGVLRYGFFEAYMDQPLERLPSFCLVLAKPQWMQRLALSIWTLPGLAPRWLGERPWSPLVGIGSVLNTALAMPLQMPELLAARISLGPYG